MILGLVSSIQSPLQLVTWLSRGTATLADAEDAGDSLSVALSRKDAKLQVVTCASSSREGGASARGTR